MTLWHGNAFRIIGPLWARDPLVTGGSPHKGPIVRSFDIPLVLSLKYCLICKSTVIWGTFERPYNEIVIGERFVFQEISSISASKLYLISICVKNTKFIKYCLHSPVWQSTKIKQIIANNGEVNFSYGIRNSLKVFMILENTRMPHLSTNIMIKKTIVVNVCVILKLALQN